MNVGRGFDDAHRDVRGARKHEPVAASYIPFSSGFTFSGWTELEDSPVLFEPPIPYDSLVTWLPRTWLLKTGWLRHGTISYEEVPGD